MTRTDSKKASVVQEAKRLIQKEALLKKGDSVLVGLSGGADSVALLMVLLELREEYELSLSCAHVNHCLRGEQAHRDMEFVKELCNHLELPLAVLEEDVGQFAKTHGLSVEDAGRQIRYRFFGEQGSQKIATAHIKDDNAETVLMNLIKGNLPKGILAKRGKIIRPLLGVTKAEIYDYLKEKNQPFVTDETNFSTDYLRNQIRLELIPYIQENFNKNFTNTIYNTTDVLHQEQDFLEDLCETFLSEHAEYSENSITLSIKPLTATHPALGKKILRHAYFSLTGGKGRISYEEIDRIWQLCHKGQSGQRISLSASFEALRCSDQLIFTKKAEPLDFSVNLEEEVVCCLPTGVRIVLSKEPVEDCSYCYPITVPPSSTVTVRNRKPGDTIYLKNLGIHKKLSDFMIDKKIPLPKREEIPLVTVDERVRVVVGYFYEQPDDEDLESEFYIIVT